MGLKNLFDREIYNIILIHVARTWERIRLTQPHEEMPLDNIESTDAIEEISTAIINDDVLQKFLLSRSGDVWLETKEGMSDIYIEARANETITKKYL